MASIAASASKSPARGQAGAASSGSRQLVGTFTPPQAPEGQAQAAEGPQWQPARDGAAAAAASQPPEQAAPTPSLSARQHLDLSAGSSATATKGDPGCMPPPSGAAERSPALQGPSLPLTPGSTAERLPAAPSSASPLLLRRPAAAVASTPAPCRAAVLPCGRSTPALHQGDAAAPAPPSPALLEARAGVQEADALLRQAHAQRRQLWDLADRLLAAERGGRREAERALWQARHQVRAGSWTASGNGAEKKIYIIYIFVCNLHLHV